MPPTFRDGTMHVPGGAGGGVGGTGGGGGEGGGLGGKIAQSVFVST
jgi:hypothetical protein